MIRNPTPPSAPRTDLHEVETEQARAARIQAMRDAWLAGTLDVTVPDDANGLRRLLRDVFSNRGPGRP